MLVSFLWHGIASFDDETAQWVRGRRRSRVAWTHQEWRRRKDAKCTPLGSFQFISPSFSLTQVQMTLRKMLWDTKYTLLVGFSLRCYSDLSSGEASRCEERKGFRSCFVKYDKGKTSRTWSKFTWTWFNLDGYVGGRGCSTKHQKFSTSCENHIIGGLGEERCE